MSDRIKGFTVTLDKDYKDEDAEIIATAIGMIKGVMQVTSSVVDPGDYMNRGRIQMELRQKLYDVLKD
jgi:hypothetical protein